MGSVSINGAHRCRCTITAIYATIEPLAQTYSPGSLFTCGACANRAMHNISDLHCYRSTNPEQALEKSTSNGERDQLWYSFVCTKAPPINKNQKLYFRPSGSIVSKIAVTILQRDHPPPLPTNPHSPNVGVIQ